MLSYFKLGVNVGIITDVVIINGVKFLLSMARTCKNFYLRKKCMLKI